MAEEAAAAWRRTSPPPPPPPTTNQPQPATMAEEAAAAGATPLLEGLPDEIVLWEILVRLDPKSLLRCRAVRRAWRCATSARRFLLAHHARQPSLPIVFGDGYHSILAFDHRASADAQLHTITPLDEDFLLEVSCDGLLVLSKFDYIAGFRTYLSVCNPATRQHASFRPLSGFDILGMYPHSATGEYRLLLQRKNYMESSKEQIGFYVFGFGSDQPPRYIGCSETKLGLAVFNVPVRLRDSLHWYPLEYNTESNNWGYEEESKLVLTVFDTIAESFRQMRAPLGATNSSIFKVDDMLGIYNCNQAMEIVDIWVLQDYESEVWDLKYRVELRLAELIEIRGKLEGCDGDGNWGVVTIASVYVGKMDPHGPGGGPGWGGPTGWGLGGRGPVPPGGPGFPGVPRPGSWGPGFGGFFGSCFYLLCCCCLLQDCCGPLFGHPGPGGPPPPF